MYIFWRAFISQEREREKTSSMFYYETPWLRRLPAGRLMNCVGAQCAGARLTCLFLSVEANGGFCLVSFSQVTPLLHGVRHVARNCALKEMGPVRIVGSRAAASRPSFRIQQKIRHWLKLEKKQNYEMLSGQLSVRKIRGWSAVDKIGPVGKLKK